MRTLVGLPFALIALLFVSASAFGEENETLQKFDKAWHFRGPESGQIIFSVLENGAVDQILVTTSSKNPEIDKRAESMVKANGPYKVLASTDKRATCYEYKFGPKPSLKKIDLVVSFAYLKNPPKHSYVK